MKNARFSNLDGYFKMGEPIFKMQQEVYDIFSSYRYYLIGGGTGIGKTAVIPMLFIYYMSTQLDVDDVRVIIAEPRITTTKNPYEFFLKNIGMEYKFTFEETELEEATDLSNSSGSKVQMKYKGLKSQDEDYIILYATDGTIFNKLINSADSFIKKHSLLVIDEAHENGLNSVLALVILSAIIEKDEKLRYEDRKYKHFKIMLITAMCQPIEKKTFHALMPGLFDIDNLPNKTKFTIIEKTEFVANFIKLIDIRQNGLVFVPTSLKIDEYIVKIKSSYPSLNVFKLTRETNKTLYNGDITKVLSDLLLNKKTYLVLATNVAESSITFPTLNYIIDFGQQFTKNYDIKTKIDSMSMEYMTRNSRVQRLGRLGRTNDGIYYSLYNISSLVEYKNKIISENLSINFLTIIIKMTDVEICKSIFTKLSEDFNAKVQIDQYIQDFIKLGWIKDWSATDDLKNIFKLKASILRKNNKFLDSEDADDSDDNISLQDESIFKLACILYYHYSDEVKLFIKHCIENNINNILFSNDYSQYIRSNPNYKSDIIPLINYIFVKYNKKECTTDCDKIDVKKSLSDAIGIACFFDRVSEPKPRKYSKVSTFSYRLRLQKNIELLHAI